MWIRSFDQRRKEEMKLRELNWGPFDGDEECAVESIFTYYANKQAAEVRVNGELVFHTSNSKNPGFTTGKDAIDSWRADHVAEMLA